MPSGQYRHERKFDYEKAKELKDKGWTQKAIAEEFKVAKSAIQRAIKIVEGKCPVDNNTDYYTEGKCFREKF